MEKSVFIVDDDIELLGFYSNIFEVNGWEISAMAMNGKDALDLYNNLEKYPEIVILDLILPDISGIDIAAAILNLNSNQKVIFISGNTYLLDEDPIFRKFPRLEKPFTISQLFFKLEAFINQSKDN